jgi:hypothetical protein
VFALCSLLSLLYLPQEATFIIAAFSGHRCPDCGRDDERFYHSRGAALASIECTGFKQVALLGVGNYMPSFIWLDKSVKHSDHDTARATAIACKITQIQDAQERSLAAIEDGYGYDPYEDCDCKFCVSQNHHCDGLGTDGCCSLCEHPTTLTECSQQAEDARQEALAQSERDLEIELLHGKLQLLGARMMRPYEHWGEAERYMKYMESDRY